MAFSSISVDQRWNMAEDDDFFFLRCRKILSDDGDERKENRCGFLPCVDTYLIAILLLFSFSLSLGLVRLYTEIIRASFLLRRHLHMCNRSNRTNGRERQDIVQLWLISYSCFLFANRVVTSKEEDSFRSIDRLINGSMRSSGHARLADVWRWSRENIDHRRDRFNDVSERLASSVVSSQVPFFNFSQISCREQSLMCVDRSMENWFLENWNAIAQYR